MRKPSPRVGVGLLFGLWHGCLVFAVADLTTSYYDASGENPLCLEGPEAYMLDCVFVSHVAQYSLSKEPTIDEKKGCADSGYEFMEMDSSFPQAKVYWHGGAEAFKNWKTGSYNLAHPKLGELLETARDRNPACVAEKSGARASMSAARSLPSSPPPVLAVACDAKDSNQAWSYHDTGFLVHQASGLALRATGGELDKNSSVPVLDPTPQMEPAQWLYDQKTGKLHAFRGNGNRCLALAPIGCPGGAPSQPLTPAVVTCDDGTAGTSPEQRFPTFFPDLDPHSAKVGPVRFGCMDALLCLTVQDGASAVSAGETLVV